MEWVRLLIVNSNVATCIGHRRWATSPIWETSLKSFLKEIPRIPTGHTSFQIKHAPYNDGGKRFRDFVKPVSRSALTSLYGRPQVSYQVWLESTTSPCPEYKTDQVSPNYNGLLRFIFTVIYSAAAGQRCIPLHQRHQQFCGITFLSLSTWLSIFQTCSDSDGSYFVWNFSNVVSRIVLAYIFVNLWKPASIHRCRDRASICLVGHKYFPNSSFSVHSTIPNPIPKFQYQTWWFQNN